MVVELRIVGFKKKGELEMDETFAFRSERSKRGRVEVMEDDAEGSKGLGDEVLKTVDVARFWLRESSSKHDGW